jgi:hypothetical protein
LPAEPTEEAGENEHEDILWEDGNDDNNNDDEEEEENPALKSADSARETASSTAMDVEEDDGVDIGLQQLCDYLSDDPAMSPLVDVREGPNVMKKAASSSAPRVFEVRDILNILLRRARLPQPQFETV